MTPARRIAAATLAALLGLGLAATTTSSAHGDTTWGGGGIVSPDKPGKK
ncbi:hypothetical protein [Nocardioides gansuensis]|nr:hypothetical protein [Nocardioides gansuensis]